MKDFRKIGSIMYMNTLCISHMHVLVFFCQAKGCSLLSFCRGFLYHTYKYRHRNNQVLCIIVYSVFSYIFGSNKRWLCIFLKSL